MEPSTVTPAQLLATLLIGEDISVWIRRRRDQGATWKIITRDIYEKTDHQLDLTQKTVQTWAAL